MNFSYRIYNTAFFLCFFINIGLTQQALTEENKDRPGSIFQVLQQENIKEITIKTNVKALIKSRLKKDPKYQSGVLSYLDSDGEIKTWAIDVKARGKMRKEYCSFPPIKIRFTKGDLEQADLKAKYNTLKFVTHCKTTLNSEQRLLRELFIYQMYNLLTAYSYQVKLVKIIYEDIEEKVKPKNHYAYIIENAKEMAKRLDSKIVKPETLNLSILNAEVTAIQDLFHFMISNTDYKVKGIHNVELIAHKKQKYLYPIPFDFDYAGLVDAPYAIPAEGLAIEEVSERIFIGFCQSDTIWSKAIQVFQEKKKAIYQLLENTPDFDKNSRAYIEKYLNEFYAILDNPNSVQSLIKDFCVK